MYLHSSSFPLFLSAASAAAELPRSLHSDGSGYRSHRNPDYSLTHGQASWGHFNPAISLTYYRRGKIVHWDAMFYILSQFLGGIVGVGVSRLMLVSRLADPSVEYAVTIPGRDGTGAAFAAECLMAALLMRVVLWTSNRPRLAPYTSYCVGVLIAVYIVLFAPISGFSINLARTVGSAVFADIWIGS